MNLRKFVKYSTKKAKLIHWIKNTVSTRSSPKITEIKLTRKFQRRKLFFSSVHPKEQQKRCCCNNIKTFPPKKGKKIVKEEKQKAIKVKKESNKTQ